MQLEDKVIVYSADGQRRLKTIEAIVGGEIYLKNFFNGCFIKGWNGIDGLKARVLLPVSSNDLEDIERARLCTKLNAYKFKNISLKGLQMLDDYVAYLIESEPHKDSVTSNETRLSPPFPTVALE